MHLARPAPPARPPRPLFTGLHLLHLHPHLCQHRLQGRRKGNDDDKLQRWLLPLQHRALSPQDPSLLCLLHRAHRAGQPSAFRLKRRSVSQLRQPSDLKPHCPTATTTRRRRTNKPPSSPQLQLPLLNRWDHRRVRHRLRLFQPHLRLVPPHRWQRQRRRSPPSSHSRCYRSPGPH